jgi:hemoglobin
MTEVLFGDAITGDALRAVLVEFYRRVFDDVMIGFMFAGKDRARLVDKEWEMAAAVLGAPGVKYTGRPMRSAHAQHVIFGGQFERRLKILKDVMAAQGVDARVQAALVAHAEALRSQVTRDRGSECSDPATSDPGLRQAPAPPNPDAPIKLGRR